MVWEKSEFKAPVYITLCSGERRQDLSGGGEEGDQTPD
jgi:hypothetical protein